MHAGYTEMIPFQDEGRTNNYWENKALTNDINLMANTDFFKYYFYIEEFLKFV